MHEASEAVGWILTPGQWSGVVVVWTVLVLAYGIWRSRGEAPQDPHRPSGPIV